MKKQTIYYILGALVLIIATSFYFYVTGSSGPEKIEASTGVIFAENPHWDFGDIGMYDGDVSHSFLIKNTGPEEVVITSVYTSCMCTSARIIDSVGDMLGVFGMPGHGPSSDTSISVAPEEGITVDALFDPAAHGPSGVGLAERSIYLETNSEKSPRIELAFSATVFR